MGVLSFDGVNDTVKSTSLTSALANVSDGAWTVAALVRFGAADTDFDGISYLLSGSGTGVVEAGISLNGAERLLVDISSQPDSGTALTPSAVHIVVAKKAAGTIRPTYDWKEGSGGLWQHAAPGGGSALADQIAATMLEIGAWQGSDFFQGHIGLVGWWEGDMSNAQVEALSTGWQTSTWWNHSFGQPECLIELNTTTPVDLAGNAASLTVNGATLDGAQTLDSWNFNGTGSTPTLLQRRPRLLVPRSRARSGATFGR